MGLSSGIILIILGGLCLPGLVAGKSPKAKELLDKIVPFQGWLGLVTFVWGLWGIVTAVTTLGWLGSWPLWWATRLTANVLNFAGGALLGFGMIQKFLLAKAPAEAQAKAEALFEKLVKIQSKVGIACLVGGLWVILYELVLQGLFNI